MHDLLKIQNQCYKAYQKKRSMERTPPHDTSMQTMSFSDCSCSRWQYQASFTCPKTDVFLRLIPVICRGYLADTTGMRTGCHTPEDFRQASHRTHTIRRSRVEGRKSREPSHVKHRHKTLMTPTPVFSIGVDLRSATTKARWLDFLRHCVSVPARSITLLKILTSPPVYGALTAVLLC